MKKEIPTYYIDFDETNENSGMNIISIVDEPAIKEYSMRFNNVLKSFKFKLDGDKQKIVGPALIPDLPILRYDSEKDEYFNVVFTKPVIEKMVNHFNKKLVENKFNFQHSEKLINATLIGNWVIESKDYDKSKFYGFEQLPEGTWFVEAKIESEEDWLLIKEMDNVGFSIEGLLSLSPTKEEFNELNNNKIKKIKMKLGQKIVGNKLIMFNEETEEVIKEIPLEDLTKMLEEEKEEEMEVIEDEKEEVIEDEKEIETEEEKEEEIEEEAPAETEPSEMEKTVASIIEKLAELEIKIAELSNGKEEEKQEFSQTIKPSIINSILSLRKKR